MAIPALTRAYSARVNVPFGTNNTTALLLHQFAAWSLMMHLTNNHSTGTASSVARDANSVWTVLGSSDGATAGMDGVNRWTTTFTPSKLVRAASGSAHSWIALRNAASALECVIALNSVTDGTGSVTFTRVAAGFSGGSTTARPSAAALNEFCAGTRSAPASTTTVANSFGNDFTLSGTNYSSCVFGPDGTFAHFLHRAGTALAHASCGLWQTVGAHASDSRNWYAWVHGSATARGSPAHGTMVGASSYFSTRLNDGTIGGSGGARSVTFGGTSYVSSFGLDTGANVFWDYPIEFVELGAQIWKRGYFPDLHWVGTSAMGSYPSVAAQTHQVVGDCAVPFPAGCVLSL